MSSTLFIRFVDVSFNATTSALPNAVHYCCLDCTSQTNSGLKYSKPVNTVSGCPHEYALCNVKMGLAGLLCNPDQVMMAYSTGRYWKVGSDIPWLYLKEAAHSPIAFWSCFSQVFMRTVRTPYWEASVISSSLKNTSVAPQQKQHYHRQPYKQYHSVEQSAVWLWVQRIQWPIMWPDVIIITKPSTY